METIIICDDFSEAASQDSSSNNNAVVSWNELITAIGLHK
jgi:hypothetical protein